MTTKGLLAFASMAVGIVPLIAVVFGGQVVIGQQRVERCRELSGPIADKEPEPGAMPRVDRSHDSASRSNERGSLHALRCACSRRRAV